MNYYKNIINNIPKNLLLILLLTGTLSLMAQVKDPEAEIILEEFKTKTQSYPAIKANFKISIVDLKEETETSVLGEFILKDPKYIMKMNNMEIYYDGKTLWNYLPDEEEVNINTPDQDTEDQDFFENPSLFFSDYRKGFSYKLINEEEHEGKTYAIIDLYPNDLNKPYSRIRIYINRKSLELFSAQYFGKDGMRYQLEINDYDYSQVRDTLFQFDPSIHPNIEVIDLR